MQTAYLIPFVGLFMLSSGRSFFQTNLPEMFQCAVESAEKFEPKQLQIYIVSDPRCGYSARALKDIGALTAEAQQVGVIAMDISGKSEKIKDNAALKFYAEYNIHIIDASPCGMKYQKFIPVVYVFDESSERLLWKLRGWGKGDLDKFKKRLAKYLI